LRSSKPGLVTDSEDTRGCQPGNQTNTLSIQ